MTKSKGKIQREVSGVTFSYYDKGKDNSEFHQRCIPTTVQQRGAPVAPSSGPSANQQELDVVRTDTIWKQSVKKEWDSNKSWKNNWGFMAEFDEKGEPKLPPELPDRVNMFSENVPNTNAGNYGARQETDVGVKMQNLEFQFHSENRRRKCKELICY